VLKEVTSEMASTPSNKQINLANLMSVHLK